MPMPKTKPIYKVCPVCKDEFPVCPPGQFSRTLPRNEQVFCSKPCANYGRYRRSSTCNPLEPEVAAYIAGFLDADGSVIIFKRKRKMAMRVSFSNCKRKALDWIHDKIGVGNITKASRSNKKHATAFFLFINSGAALSLLRLIEPYIIIKQPQAQLAIWFQERMHDPALNTDIEWQYKVQAEMQEMNRRGPSDL